MVYPDLFADGFQKRWINVLTAMNWDSSLLALVSGQDMAAFSATFDYFDAVLFQAAYEFSSLYEMIPRTKMS
ncbi:MAG: hypothetical protein U5L00_18415 [Desulfovermiculus sp.]|nr:hypothetical protein [Desulfovermiculus sp.]